MVIETLLKTIGLTSLIGIPAIKNLEATLVKSRTAPSTLPEWRSVLMRSGQKPILAAASTTSQSKEPLGQCYKTFLSVIYGFSYKDIVFVRLGWKSLPGTNTLAYYENS
jgi:hypothetical protein